MPEEYQRDAGIIPLPASVAGTEAINAGQFSIRINAITVAATGDLTVKQDAQLMILA